MKRYEAKRAVIIGGTSGMGLATAKMLLDGSARVLVTALNRREKSLGTAPSWFERRAVVDRH